MTSPRGATVNQPYMDKVRVICHSLRMASLAGVDPNRLVDLSSRIRALPSPERIASMGHSDLVELSTRVERLIFDIGNSKNSRTTDFAIRHRIDKGIPPRLAPVLGENWLERSASEIPSDDYSRRLHPDWNVVKTEARIGPSRVLLLRFGKTPVYEFVLTRRPHLTMGGKEGYDGDIRIVRRFPVGFLAGKGIREPMTIEVSSRAQDAIGYMGLPMDATAEEFHAVMRDGLPPAGEE